MSQTDKMLSADTRPVRVALDESVRPWGPEVQYVFRTLLRIAGYPCEFVDAADVRANTADIHYGRVPTRLRSGLTIAATNRPFAGLADIEPQRLGSSGGLWFLEFENDCAGMHRPGPDTLQFTSDVVFASYWLLTGAREPRYPRDRWGNLSLDGSFFLTQGLASKPIVSLYGAFLRRWFTERGLEARSLPWATNGHYAFAFSHDVDYPEMIRWIECLRLIRTRGARAFRTIRDVVAGRSHFWKFPEWIEFESQLGARPAFYFMARRGSLLKYATGTPDAFYDIRTERFGELFRLLREAGCEIGLHASYHGHRSADQLRAEKVALERTAGVPVEGNRHHYWHLDPEAPNDTLLKHEQIGLKYDTSLAFEFYPGFRRGICHPFRVFHPTERRELDLIEVPPAWMDDHFDRRLPRNRVVDPVASARELMEAGRATGGAIVVDYHVRGMNGDFFPNYGPWLKKFLEAQMDSSISFLMPREIARSYRAYEAALDGQSRNCVASDTSIAVLTGR
jgi:hypothetical protein